MTDRKKALAWFNGIIGHIEKHLITGGASKRDDYEELLKQLHYIKTIREALSESEVLEDELDIPEHLRQTREQLDAGRAATITKQPVIDDGLREAVEWLEYVTKNSNLYISEAGKTISAIKTLITHAMKGQSK